MNKHATITIEFTIDPYQSATCLLATQPKGYRFVKLERAGNKASVTYKKLTENLNART